MASVREVLTGTVRFGIFRTARFYLGAHAELSPATRAVVEIAATRMGALAAAVRRRAFSM